MVKTRSSETSGGIARSGSSKRKSSAFAASTNKSQQIQGDGGGGRQKKNNKQGSKKHKHKQMTTSKADDGRPPLKDAFKSKELMMEISKFCTVADIVALSRTSMTLHRVVVANLKDWTCDVKAGAASDGDIDDDASSDDEEGSDLDLDDDDDDENRCGRRLFHGFGVPDSCATCKVKRCGECAEQVLKCPGCSDKECACCVIDRNDPETECGACGEHFCGECCEDDGIFYLCHGCDENFCSDCNPQHTVGRMCMCDSCVWKCNECNRVGCDDDKVPVHYCGTCENTHCEECIKSKRGDYCDDCVTKPTR